MCSECYKMFFDSMGIMLVADVMCSNVYVFLGLFLNYI